MDLIFGFISIAICLVPVCLGIIMSFVGIFLIPLKTDNTEKTNTIKLDKQKEIK